MTTDELKKVIALSDLPDEHLQWIIDHSEYHEYEDGELVGKLGDPAEDMIFLLDGKVDFYMDVGGRLVFFHHFANDTESGGVTGLLPYSRMKTYPGNSFANGKIRTLRMHKKYFHELEQMNPGLVQKLIGYMTERARTFATTQMQHEKVNALGKLSAGIAHELNNPASAINRIANELSGRLFLNIELTERMLAASINPDKIRFLREKMELITSEKKHKMSAMERMENEDDLMDWLEENRIPVSQEVVETFSENGFTRTDLENFYMNVPQEELSQILLWIENLLSSKRIIRDLEEASNRISNLVGAIKSHVHMDRTHELQPTNLHQDIENTLTLLGYKLRDKNISVEKKFCGDMIEIPAYIGELNQVWTNIIDNAIYAMDKNGCLIIETSCNSKDVNIKIIDNGTGIPPEIMSRIFDPFYTTKKVGDGTGIGLDLVSRIVKRHNGEIEVHSVPGRTEFHICLPIQMEV